MKKKLLAMMMILAMVVPTIFAQGQNEDGGKVKVGALIRNLNEQFVKDYADNLVILAEEAGIDLDLQDAQSDVARQLDQLNTLVTRGYKYFVIIPQDTSATEQMAKQIKAAGGGAAFSNIQPSVDALKVDKTFFYSSSPESVAGQYQAQIVNDYFMANPEKAPGKVLNCIYIEGQLGHPAQISRESGFIDECERLGYTVNFVAKDTANWTPDQAQEKMDTWIAAHNGEFNVVVAQNDGMALGAVESLITNGMTKDNHDDGTILTVPVIGIDATADALNSMDEFKLFATVLQDAIGQSSTAFELVAAMARGENAYGMTSYGIAPSTKTIDEVPANDPAIIGQCYLVPFKPVTRENYKDFM